MRGYSQWLAYVVDLVETPEISKTYFFMSQANQLWTRRASIVQGHGVSRD